LAPVRIARLLFEKSKYWKRQKLAVEKLSYENWCLIFDYIEKNPVLIEKVEDIIEQFLKDKDANLWRLLKKFQTHSTKAPAIEKTIESIITNEMPDLSSMSQKERYLMGKVMQECRGYIPAMKIRKLITTYIKQYGAANE
jgi:Glu-tRNA(Gln) amidotransferase subunit E-like FAD-binding protein